MKRKAEKRGEIIADAGKEERNEEAAADDFKDEAEDTRVLGKRGRAQFEGSDSKQGR